MKSILEEKKLYDKYSIILLIIEVLQCLCQFPVKAVFSTNELRRWSKLVLPRHRR